MKLNILLPLSSAVLAAIVLWTFSACRSANKRTTEEKRLPESCSLLAMSPKDREAHLQRLDQLRKAGRLLRETTAGFEFTVDLHLMSARDLHTWMENEQKCCSFLQMTNRVLAAKAQAEVSVACPRAMRAEVIRSFGLLGDEKSH